jgi:hypothetical protein
MLRKLRRPWFVRVRDWLEGLAEVDETYWGEGNPVTLVF